MAGEKSEHDSFLQALGVLPFPRRKFWSYLVSLFKTGEVFVFKLLQVLDLYRPQKSIVGIPSLATKKYTVIQAVVYNGTQEEVLGFRPRRLLHRILKGLPDLEAYERVRFQLSLGPNMARTVEDSTETRGFIQRHLPWQLPAEAQGKAWLRMTPAGVETLLGTVDLGDYEVLSSPVFFLTEQVKWVVISDIDDTVKDSRIAETTGFSQIVSSIFRGHYYKYEPIQGMAELYQKIVARGGMVVYVTSTPIQLAPFLLKFLRQCNFPEGPVFLRWLGYGAFGHKWRTIQRILSNVTGQRAFLIGDSGEQDLQIYRRIYDTPQLRNSIERILIRHVPGTPLPPVQGDREMFYKDISELTAILDNLVQ